MSDTITTDHWRLIIAGCRDGDEQRRVVAAYQAGYSGGQRSITETIHQAVMAAVKTPQPPEEPPTKPRLDFSQCLQICWLCNRPTASARHGLCPTCDWQPRQQPEKDSAP